MKVRPTLILLLLIPFLVRAGDSATLHLLAGAQAFRAADFSRALIEFRVAERLGAGDEAAWYVGASLVKLGRAEESLEAFARAMRHAPTSRDPLLDFYRGLACYQAKLYLCADALFKDISDRAGPRLSEQARKIRTEIARMFKTAPSESVIDWYHAKAAESHAASRIDLATAYLQEGIALGQRRTHCYRCEEARSRLAKGSP